MIGERFIKSPKLGVPFFNANFKHRLYAHYKERMTSKVRGVPPPLRCSAASDMGFK